MRQMAKETHIKTDKNPLLAGVLGSYIFSKIYPQNTPRIVIAKKTGGVSPDACTA
jgi:hypothetical protein